MDNREVRMKISKNASFIEFWYEGSVEWEGKEHKFWLIDPQGEPPHDFDLEVRWFYKSVPKEVRALYPIIIKAFKHIENEN